MIFRVSGQVVERGLYLFREPIEGDGPNGGVEAADGQGRVSVGRGTIGWWMARMFVRGSFLALTCVGLFFPPGIACRESTCTARIYVVPI